jgi:leucyl/phenylalanyl-tRNA--protein transferase
MKRRRRAWVPPSQRGRVEFPDPSTASPEGIVAVGAKPTPEVLKDAYRRGIFPWPHEGYPLLWFSPDPRFVLEPTKAHLHKSLRKAMKKTELVIKADTNFRAVIEACSDKKRPGQRGTWITDEMIEGYTALHGEGYAHSIEAWQPLPAGETLVGGLYGISFGNVFYGESMFQIAPDASKIAFATLLANLITWKFDLVDCQSYTDHLARFGAVHWPRRRFLDVLANSLKAPTREGKWSLAVTPKEAVDIVTAPMPESSEGEDE